MAPRHKSENSRVDQYRLRLTSEERQKLEFCVDKLKITKAEVFRAGLDKMYEKAISKTE